MLENTVIKNWQSRGTGNILW